MNADADWLDSEEICIDNITAHELLLPFIERYMPSEFLFHNEINLMPLSKAAAMSGEIRNTALLLQRDYGNAALAGLKEHLAIDLLVSAEDYNAKYLLLSPGQKEQAVQDHIGTAIAFYVRIAKWLDSMTSKYVPLGFSDLAVTSPV